MDQTVNRLWYQSDGEIRLQGFDALGGYALLKFMPSGIVISGKKNSVRTVVPSENLFLTKQDSGWLFYSRRIVSMLSRRHVPSGVLFVRMGSDYYQI